MKLLALGTGGAFAPVGQWNTSMVLSSDTQNLLLDCGPDIRHSLANANMSFSDIQAVYISHLHSDHVGGLEQLAFATYFTDGCPKPKLFIAEDLLQELKDMVMPGLAHLLGSVAVLDTYFEVIPVTNSFEYMGCTFLLKKLEHIRSYDFSVMYSYGLIFNTGSKQVFWTSDALMLPADADAYLTSDLIIHDCETSSLPSGVHAHYQQLRTLPAEIKSKMWLIHYSDSSSFAIFFDSFAGFIEVGQRLSL